VTIAWDLVTSWVLAFAFTQIVEVPIYRRAFKASFGEAFGASLVTHPIVWLVMMPRTIGFAIAPAFLADASWQTRAIVMELFAWLAEAAWFGLLFRRRPFRRALFWTFVANVVSLMLGFLAQHLFGRF
jgi:hypothetical protein